MDNEAYILSAGDNGDVEVCAIGVGVGYRDEAVVVVAAVLGGVVVGVDRPAGVVAVGAMVVDADIARQNRGRIGEAGSAGVELCDAGVGPVFKALRGGIDEEVVGRVLVAGMRCCGG